MTNPTNPTINDSHRFGPIDITDPSDLRELCKRILNGRYQSISLDDCTAILNADESLFQDLKDAYGNNDEGNAFLHKASAIYEGFLKDDPVRLPQITPEPPPEDTQTILERIDAFLDILRPLFLKFVDQGEPLTKWCPPDDDPDFLWFKEQQIPSSGGKPDFLLHKLGSFASDKESRRRLDEIFQVQTQSHKFVVNTSGSGKTKTMLEGLCLHWGFYFASVVDSNCLGSCDVENAIRSYVPDSPGFVKNLSDTASLTEYMISLDQNRRIASKRFAEVLLARFIIFQLFIDIIKNRTDVAEPKKLWLLLQLHPMRLAFPGGDFFDYLTAELRNAPAPFVKDQVKRRLFAVRQFCCKDMNASPFFIVLDEAQHAARSHFSAFRTAQDHSRSRQDHSTHRPILREIVRAWVILFFQGLGFWMVVSGTGVDSDVIDKVLASAVMKPSAHRMMTNVGASTSRHEHVEFIRQCMPPRYLKTPSGKALVKRMSYWLHGRHRFTTAFLSELISQRLRSPHRLLNDFVKTYTGGIKGITPTDGQTWVVEEPDAYWPTELQSNTFDFTKLAKHPDMEEKIRQIVNSNLVRGGLPTDVTVQEKLFVEYGFARHTELSTNKIVIDEPLVLLAASTHMRMRSSYYFSQQINMMATTGSFNGFEDYLAFVFPVLFANQPQLSEVFDFTESGFIPSWASCRAELVSVHNTGSETEESVVLPEARPHFTYGTDTGEDTTTTLQWLNHGTQTFVCFPPRAMGPELLCVLRVLDGTPTGSLLWVAVQAKYGEAHRQLESKTLRSAIRSVTPDRFWKDKKDGVFRPQKSPLLVKDTLQALQNLPNRIMEDAGTYSMLRVVAACPLRTGLTQKRASGYLYYADIGEHPLASLNMKFLAEATQDLNPARKIFDLMDMFDDLSVPDVVELGLDNECDEISDTESLPDDDDVSMPPAASTSKRPFQDDEDSDEGSHQTRTKKPKSKGRVNTKAKGKGKPAAAVKKGKGRSTARRSAAWDTSTVGDVSMSSASPPPSDFGSVYTIASVADGSTTSGFVTRTTRGGNEF